MANKYQSIMERLGINPNPGYSPSHVVSASEKQALDEVEAQLGYSLPLDYREFLIGYGGCSPHADYAVQEDTFVKDEGLAYTYGEPPHYLDIVTNYQESLRNYYPDPDVVESYLGLSLVRSMEGVEEMGWPAELLPIGSSAGGSSVCLALFGLRPGAIFFWRNSPFDNAQNLYLAANSFDEFMHLLHL